MLKKASVVVLVVLGLALAACSSPQAAPANNPGSTSAPNASSQGNNGSAAGGETLPISLESKLLVGTLDLEATDQSVTAAQAKVLLPLWQQVKTLSAESNPSFRANPSSTAAGSSTPGANSTSTDEMTSVLNQIQQAMTADQLKAIDAMHLTATDVQSELEELGIPTPQGGLSNFNGTPFPTLSADQRATRAAERQTPGANGGGGGFGGFRGTPSPNGTPGFSGGNRGAFNSLLIDAVINLLTQRAGQ
jgi:hypothetical protein